jgi:hypothetical protein
MMLVSDTHDPLEGDSPISGLDADEDPQDTLKNAVKVKGQF